jgi:hypothetical protein
MLSLKHEERKSPVNGLALDLQDGGLGGLDDPHVGDVMDGQGWIQFHDQGLSRLLELQLTFFKIRRRTGQINTSHDECSFSAKY